jgi:putative endonuclease
MAFYTYIMACQSNTAIYIGVTGDLRARVYQHMLGHGSVHTSKYRIRKLVYFEAHESLPEAIARERKLKRWRRDWKNTLINENNPNWSDLAMEVSFL